MKSCVTRTVYCGGGGGRLLPALLLGLGCDQSEWLQDGLLVSLFQVHGFIWGQRAGGGGRGKNQFFILIIWLTVVIHLLWPSSLRKSVAFSWLTWRSEIACSKRSLMLFEGEKGLPENDCWDRGCPDAPNHALHTHAHTLALCTCKERRMRDTNRENSVRGFRKTASTARPLRWAVMFRWMLFCSLVITVYFIHAFFFFLEFVCRR